MLTAQYEYVTRVQSRLGPNLRFNVPHLRCGDLAVEEDRDMSLVNDTIIVDPFSTLQGIKVSSISSSIVLTPGIQALQFC